MSDKPLFENHLIGRILKKRHALTKKVTNKGWLGKTLLGAAAFGIVGIFVGFIFIITVISDIPDLPTSFDNIESTIIYDRDGNVLYTIHGEENRKEIPLSDIPKHVIDATISIEDDQFFEHFGFDVGGIAKAFLAEYLGIGARRGGSTITQQLVKNTLLSSERTLTRKVKELILSIQIERTFSKNEILSMYLNTIPYGNNAYGIEMASRVYFDKHAPDLSIAEAAILASLPQAPSRYNPYGNGEEQLMGYFNDEGDYVAGRKDLVLKRMEDLGYISPEERQTAFEEGLEKEFKKYREDITYPHFVLYVKELLENKFGKEAVETGGLHVYTTIDPRIQDRAEEIISEQMEFYPERYEATNAAALTVDTETGQILAMVGSADYFNEEIDGNVNIVFRQRLPGSSFKPIVYASAFAKGYSPATAIYDLETDFGNDYIPQNYDGRFNGPVSARRALAHSLNVPAVKMAFLAGVDNVVNQAKKMGLTDLIDGDQYGTSIGLGTGEATLYQMVTAFSVFAKGGDKIAFTPFLRIETGEGKVIESNEEMVPKSQEVLDPQIAYSINHILSDKSARPPGWNALQIPNQINGAKTGTSNKRIRPGNAPGSIKPMDNWTIGYTTRVVTGVWVGNSDAAPLGHTAAGLTTAGPIFNAIMTEATSDHDLEEFPKPDGISWKQVSKWSGLLPSKHTPDEDIVAELFTTYNFPSETDQTFLTVEIDKVSRKLPTEFTPEEAITEALVANFRSLNPTDPNWEKPVKVWAEKYLAEMGSEEEVLSEIPTESDDIHTASAPKPKIQILSPRSGGSVAPGSLDIQVSVDAPKGVEKVEFFLDKRLADTSTSYPYTGKIRINRNAVGRKYRIGVTVTDGYYYQSSDVINVEISDDADTESPQAQILYPDDGAKFPANTNLTIKTQATDNMGIAEVAFYLDDRLMGRSSSPPYEYTLTLPEEFAQHRIAIVAKDSSGNTDRDESLITISDEDLGSARTRFVYPRSNTITTVNRPIDFFVQLSAAEQRRSDRIDVVGINGNTNREITISTSVGESIAENYSFTWIPDAEGEYSFEIVAYSGGEEINRTGNLKLEVE